MKRSHILVTVFMFFSFSLLLAVNTNYDLNGNLPKYFADADNFAESFSTASNTRTEWHGVGPWGGDVTSVVISPDDPDLLYAAMGKPYISTDAGNSWEIWESLAQYSTSVLTISISPTGTIYAGCDYLDGLFRSDDNGENWSSINNFPITLRDIRIIAIDPQNPDIVYVGVSGNSAATNWQQIAKTTNSGSSWAILDTDALAITHGITDIEIDPQNTQNLLACSEGGISGGDAIYSVDGGTSWQNISAGLPTSYPFNDMELAGTDVYLAGGQLFGSQHVGIYKAQFGEFAWEEISQDFPLPVVNKLIVSPDNDQVLYAATEGDGVYRSVDGGVNWEYSTTGADNFSVLDIIISPVNSLELYIGCKSMAVFKSSDTGSTWQSANTGMATLWINDIAVNPIDPDQILVAFEAENSGGCYISNDGGTTWQVIEDLPPTRYSAVTFDQFGIAFAISRGPTTVAPEGVYISFDGGNTWLNSGPDIGPQFETELWDIVASPTTPGLIFIAGNHFGVGGFAATVYRTYDLGSSAWEEVYIGPENDEIHSIALAANADDQILYAGYTNYNQDGAFLRSMDQGETWDYINNGIPANCSQSYAVAAHPVDPYTVYAGIGYYSAGYYIIKTEDGGDNWTTLQTTGYNPTCLAIDPLAPERLFAGVYLNGVLISENAGASWENASDGLASGTQISCFSNFVITDDMAEFYAGSYNNSAFSTTIELTVADETLIPESQFCLTNYPNPFNPSTTISFYLTTEIPEDIDLIIYNIKNQIVRDLKSDVILSGLPSRSGVKAGVEGTSRKHNIIWDGTDNNNQPVPSGIYFYQLNVNDIKAVSKMLLLK